MSDRKNQSEDDLTLETEVTDEPADPEGVQKIQKLKDQLRQCKREKAQYLEDLQRSKADFLNSKKRLEEQYKLDSQRSEDKILLDILPLVDSFDSAMGNTEAWEQCDEHWRKGIEAIYAQLMAVLKDHNVDEIGRVGSAFDPKSHEAVSSQDVEDKSKKDTVVAVLQKGFKRNDTVIRPARVIVGT